MQKIIDFMLERIGGEETLKKEFLKNKLASLNVLEMTASELMKEAVSGGWDNWLRDLTLQEFQALIKSALGKEEPPELISGSPAVQQKHQRIRRKRSSRPAEEAAVEIVQPVDPVAIILDYIRNNPWSDGAQIAANLNLAGEELAPKLMILEQKGWLKTVGTNPTMRYALA